MYVYSMLKILSARKNRRFALLQPAPPTPVLSIPVSRLARMGVLLLACATALLTPVDARAQEDSTGTTTASLAGQVVSGMTGGPLPNVRVEIRDQRKGAITDSLGHFRIDALVPGSAEVTVQHIQYGSKTVPVELAPNTVSTTTLLLSETALRMEEITVAATRSDRAGKLRGFYERRDAGGGYFITPDEVESRILQQTSDIFSGVPGLQVTGGTTGRARIQVARKGQACRPLIFFDGVAVPDASIDDLNPEDLLAVEVYRGPSETPLEFSRTSNTCGAILMWTRAGDSR